MIFQYNNNKKKYNKCHAKIIDCIKRKTAIKKWVRISKIQNFVYGMCALCALICHL